MKPQAKKSNALLFLSGKRTPFGSHGGFFKEINPSELAVAAARSALAQAEVDPKEVDHVILGNVLHSASDSIYTARHLGLKVGVPLEVPALGVNRLCGSGFQVIVEAYFQMLAGDTQIALVGGVENMSLSPYALRDVRWGRKIGHKPASSDIQDVLLETFFDSYVQLPMALTAEKLGEKKGITRQQSDDFALRSQTDYQNALKTGKFREEIVPFEGKDSQGNPISLAEDQHPRPGTTAEKLAQLKSLFKKDGLVTAGNASGIVDGAAILVVATEKEVSRRRAQPLGRLVSYGISGCDPEVMGIGPVPAVWQALKRAGMTLAQMDLIEVNEAFAAQALAVAHELEIPSELLNVNGGAIAIGHPLAATGTRIVQTLLYELKRRGKRWGLGSARINSKINGSENFFG